MPVHCPHCGWRRKLPDVMPPLERFTRGFLFGCLVAIILAMVGVVLVVSYLGGGGWGRE
jgi:hypothetical protein